MMTARFLALTILDEVMHRHGYANLSLQRHLSEVVEKDQALCTALVYTTLQHQLNLRHQWMRFAKKAPAPKVAVLLDMSLAQAFKMDKIPEYAVVSESVQLAKSFCDAKTVAWVNHILRITLEAGAENHDINTLEGLSLATSMPTWILSLWTAHYGWPKTQSIALALTQPAVMYARLHPQRLDLNEVLKTPGVQSGLICPRAFKASFNWLNTDWFKHDQLWIQDQASQYVSEQLDAQKGDRILDVCSAPGTKMALIQSSLNNQAFFDSVEIHPHRAALIRKQMDRLGLDHIQIHTMDARQLTKHFEADRFDRILVDAPCSGLGVVRRKAEIKLRLRPHDLDALVELQAEILAASAEVLKVHGRLVYATCTLNKKENEYQIRTFLNHHPNFNLEREETLFPDVDDNDGFYVAVLTRIE